MSGLIEENENTYINSVYFGQNLKLLNVKPFCKKLKTGEKLYFEVALEFIKPLPKEKLISYYISNSICEVAAFIDTDSFSSKKFKYEDVRENEIVYDTICIEIPYNTATGHYIVSTFVYPIEGYEVMHDKVSDQNRNQLILFEIEIEAETDISKRFYKLKNQRNDLFFNALVKYFKSEEINQNLDMWFKFALSTNERGRDVSSLLKKIKRIDGCNYLDVGCAYGGFSVAFSEEGADVCGFDINEELLELASYNFRDNNIYNNTMVKDVTLESDINDYLNTFDIITCNDVIEHVCNPEITIKHISMMLRENGLIYMEIPNKFYPEFVLKDGHYSIFGITLLSKTDSDKYYSFLYPDRSYDVQYYLSSEQYKELFDKYNLDFKILDESYLSYDESSIYNKILELQNNFSELVENVSVEVRSIVEDELKNYINDAINIKQHSNDAFKTKYGTAFWKIVGFKK